VIRDSLPTAVVDGVASADFRGDDAPERYDLLLTTTARLAFSDPEVRRLQVDVCTSDAPRRRALHRAGFRLEGIAREALHTADGPLDVARYALLRGDVASGREGFTAVMNTVTARKRVISHLLLTDSAGRVCVLETTFKPDFELPGGILEVGESPRAGLVREVQEELSHTVSVGRLLVVDWLAPYLGWEDAVELIFDGLELSDHAAARLRPDLKEIRAIHWLEPDAAVQRMAPFAQGRLLGALAAREERRTLYLEAGVRIS
jgi:8-oxo-dGTP pyrophosphatase MutT (NUDIX family)